MKTKAGLCETGIRFDLPENKGLVMFGGVNSNYESISSDFPNLERSKIKQVHGDKIVKSQEMVNLVEADAQWADRTGVALCIATADCLPVFIYDPKLKLVCGIHAGWRGVANEIVKKSVQSLQEAGSNPLSLRVWIGPHIGQKSFAIDEPVKLALEASYYKNFAHLLDADIFYWDLGQGKYFVNLVAIVKSQLYQVGVSGESIISSSVDTFLDERFHSHRRDREKAGRQISFIALY